MSEPVVDLLRVGGPTTSRHEPARLSANTVLRRRLVGLLRGRFDRRLTVIEGGAGFGKSTLLSQAVHENRIEHLGVDALLRVVESDQDPDQLIEGLGDALGVSGPDLTVERLADAVWAKAPDSVAVMVDDVHRLADVRVAWDVLEQLLERLPSNGHLVVSGRLHPCLPVARLLSQDEAIVVTEDDLAFTDEELMAVAELRAVPPDLAAKLPRWLALATLDEVLASGVSDIFEALAVWLQGEIDPVDAWPIARLLPERSASLPLMTATSLRSVVVCMGVVAGAHDEVAVLADHNLRSARSTAKLCGLFAEVASGLVELVTIDEETSVATFTALLDDIPIGHWPERPYLYALAVLRGLVPGTAVLDDCAFGPSLTVAVEAGAALAALRAGDSAPAAALPWQSPTLLKVHVPPPLLAELALGADTTPGATEVLESLPHLRTWLRRISDCNAGQLSKRAAAKAKATPARPPFDLQVCLMGGLSLTRSDGREMTAWASRERVRHLLAYVALGRDISRNETAAELWPDLSPEKAASNLRVNLHHLQRALQPDRMADAPPWFLESDGTRLHLASDGVTVDTELIDTAMVEAVRAESAGLPSEALRHYDQVANLAIGALLPEVDAEWAVFERMRLRSIVHAAASRQGELVLARGEPEAAMSIAARAQRLDPLSERAHRLSIRCHLALGSVSAARNAAALLRDTMSDARIPPEHETKLLLAKLDA